MRTSTVAEIFAQEWPGLVATLRRDLGDLDLAEDCAQEAFVEAAARWGPKTTPQRPGAWLLTTARHRAIDRIRRDQRFSDRLPALAENAERAAPPSRLVDDQLALLLGCCHPALDGEAKIALTLREVCGLSTAQIAAAFLVPVPTMAKRLVRAKAKIRAAGIPFDFPEREDLPARCEEALQVIYLIFTAGHTATEGAVLLRGDLCDEARWLATLLATLIDGLPAREADHERLVALAETLGLLALMQFTDARRATRTDEQGRLVLLQDADRSRWDAGLIAAGQATLAKALALAHVGAYQVEAAIAGMHSTAPTWTDTDWDSIRDLYDRLVILRPTDVVRLNHAVALAMASGPDAGPAAGLAALAELTEPLADYRYLHAARADLLRRLGRDDEAAEAYRRALDLCGNAAELAFLTHRLEQCLRQ